VEALEQRIETLEASQAQLLKRVEQLEQRLNPILFTLLFECTFLHRRTSILHAVSAAEICSFYA
jgi:BMFP domain-containing protein YqiC